MHKSSVNGGERDEKGNQQLRHISFSAVSSMANVMGKLYKEAQSNNEETNGDNEKGGCDYGATRAIGAWIFWLIVHWLDLFQVTKIVEEIVD